MHRSKLVFLVVVLISFLIFPSQTFSLPEGEYVVAGEAAFNRATADTLTIITPSERLIINYNSFNIAQQEMVNFIQPSASAIALNRVVGVDPSSIFGSLTANGRIFIINPNGVMFGPNSRIDVPALVASTLDISNADFLNGNYNFFKNGENVFIINQGDIKIGNGGYVCLLSQAVENQGTIQADLGTVVLASGEKMTLALDDLNEISVVIDEPVKEAVFGTEGQKIDSAIKNSGTITANGGKVILTAKVLNDVFDYAINNEGIIEAKSLVNRDGAIELVVSGAAIYNIGKVEASEVKVQALHTAVVNKGAIIANGTNEQPDAGEVTIEAATVLQQGLITANALEGGDAGEIIIVSETATVLDEGSSTEACALGIVGNGGRILLNSTAGSTLVNKNAVIDVSAGSISGNAGVIEISAYKQLGFYGVLNGRAPPGYKPGTVIFDPVDITIQVGGSFVVPPVLAGDLPLTLYIDPASLAGFSGFILLQATHDITLASGLYVQNSIRLEAGNNINLFAYLYVQNGDVTLVAGGTITHNPNGDVFIQNGSFFGIAGVDYIVRDGASIITENGIIDIDAGRDIIIGTPGEMITGFSWKYISGSRDYKLIELGYYYIDTNGNIVRKALATGTNITSGEGAVSPLEDTNGFGLYIRMRESGYFYTYPLLNSDNEDHIRTQTNPDGSMTIRWEDLLGLGDKDFNDVVILYTPLEEKDLLLGTYIYSYYTTPAANPVVNLAATRGNIKSYNAHVIAEALNNGNANVVFNAGNDIYLSSSEIEAGVDGEGIASVVMDASGSITAIGSVETIKALVAGNGMALVSMTSGTSISITDDTVLANVTGSGTALINMNANSGDITITNSDIEASVRGAGDATIIMNASDGDIKLINSAVTAQKAGSSDYHSEVDLLAWNGSIFSDATSLITAEFLGLLARYDIGTGTATTPINTKVEYLCAYSWDTGSIYINEFDAIQLGFYFDDGQAVGASVAANNGIIHISSVGDMIVNSIIAPAGGVLLFTLGSIYAGDGWCPAFDKYSPISIVLDGPEYFDFAQQLSWMNLSGTAWQSEGGKNYFAHIMLDPVLGGPNVIAGSYSYFAAPIGTMGVGTPTDNTVYNPLYVCIQVINSEQPAVPDGFTPIAGLTLLIGASTAPDFLIDTGNGNGFLGISGAIKGIVRPAVTAVTGVYPSPALDQTNLDPLFPPGYVFYDDTAENCCPPLPGLYGNIPAAHRTAASAYLPGNQIWPPIPTPPGPTPTAVMAYLEQLRYKLPYLEQFTPNQINPFDFITSSDLYGPVYFYHPLTESDSSAFSSLEVGADAYEFINGSLSLIGHEGLLPIFEEIGKKKGI